MCVVVSRGRGAGVGVGGGWGGGERGACLCHSRVVHCEGCKENSRVVRQVSLASSLPSMGLWLGRMSGFRENKMPRTSSLRGLS